MSTGADSEAPDIESLTTTLATFAESGRQADARARAARGHYLLVFEAESSRLFELPESGEVVVGRGESSDLVVADQTVSRAHAKLVVGSQETRVVDLGSRNGTWLNGEAIAGARELVSGDQITICGVTLVYHSRLRAGARRTVLDVGQFRRSAEIELERALLYERPLAVFVVTLECSIRERLAITEALGHTLRLMDTAAWGGATLLLLLLPEVDAVGALHEAERLRTALADVAPAARLGFAVCPSDGCDIGTLLSRARDAAQAATGAVTAAAEAFTTLTIGEHRVIVADAATTRLYALLKRLAATELTVLITGETGTGKEVCAAAVHHWSPRHARRFVVVNCAAIHEGLAESELFGHERGAFSGAVAAKPGLVEAAAGGTLFLDEVGELSPAAQAKLLRVLETRRVMRLGDVRERDVDVRIVAATNRDLDEDVKAGRFRQDLFFRLGGATVWLPPLRDRPAEIPLLAHAFLEAADGRLDRSRQAVSPAAMQRLVTHAWPGNVRELRNLIDYLAATVPDAEILPAHLEAAPGWGPVRGPTPAATRPRPAAPGAATPPFRPLAEEVEELVRSRIEAALAATNGNRTRAAALIGMPLRTFLAKLKRYEQPRRGEPGRDR
jgi:DNA-binding NtrC family response regulator/pSer/pThr/pTyr-binding forkhead associated (FHA) protein